MIFSVRRPQYFISHTKSKRLLVTRHRLCIGKVNLHNTPGAEPTRNVNLGCLWFDEGGKTRNVTLQLLLQQCCKTSCMFFVARFSVPLALHDFIFCLNKLQILSRAPLLALTKSMHQLLELITVTHFNLVPLSICISLERTTLIARQVKDRVQDFNFDSFKAYHGDWA